MERIGTVLHGAYGDYYEQLLALRRFKARHACRLIAFWHQEERRRSFSVYDLPFIDEHHRWAELNTVAVDAFHQYQVRATEMREGIERDLEPAVRRKFDFSVNRMPWLAIRNLDFRRQTHLLELNDWGREQLRQLRRLSLPPVCCEPGTPTVGFLYRFRRPGALMARGGPALDGVLRRRNTFFAALLERVPRVHIVVAGMGRRLLSAPCREETVFAAAHGVNLDETRSKFPDHHLDVAADRVTYLKGLSWCLEIELLRGMDVCVVMPSGFSEVLWMRRQADGRATYFVDCSAEYLLKLTARRMPFASLAEPLTWWLNLRCERAERRAADGIARTLSTGGGKPPASASSAAADPPAPA